jgi:hypothetical protein
MKVQHLYKPIPVRNGEAKDVPSLTLNPRRVVDVGTPRAMYFCRNIFVQHCTFMLTVHVFLLADPLSKEPFHVYKLLTKSNSTLEQGRVYDAWEQDEKIHKNILTND